MTRQQPYPVTPDGRYLVVRGRVWRRSNPSLDEAERARLTHELMARTTGYADWFADL